MTDFDCALAAMNTASLTKAQQRQLWPEICKTISQTTNIVMNSTHSAPPDTLFYGEDSKLIDAAMQPGRIGYVPKTQRSKGRLENRGDRCMFIGYADNHTRDTYRMLNLRTKGLLETKHVTWADF